MKCQTPFVTSKLTANRKAQTRGYAREMTNIIWEIRTLQNLKEEVGAIPPATKFFLRLNRMETYAILNQKSV